MSGMTRDERALEGAYSNGIDALDSPMCLVDSLRDLPRLARVAGWRPVLRAFARGWRAR